MPTGVPQLSFARANSTVTWQPASWVTVHVVVSLVQQQPPMVFQTRLCMYVGKPPPQSPWHPNRVTHLCSQARSSHRRLQTGAVVSTQHRSLQDTHDVLLADVQSSLRCMGFEAYIVACHSKKLLQATLALPYKYLSGSTVHTSLILLKETVSAKARPD